MQAVPIKIRAGQSVQDWTMSTIQHAYAGEKIVQVKNRNHEIMPLQESQWLLDQGLSSNTNSATKSIGYRQAMELLELLAIKGQEVKASDLVGYQRMTCQTSIGTCLADYCHTRPFFRQALTLPQADVLFNGCVFLSPRYLSSFANGALYLKNLCLVQMNMIA